MDIDNTCSPNMKGRRVYITLGLTGSGKTTKINRLVAKYQEKGLKCAVISTDTKGRYNPSDGSCGKLSDHCKDLITAIQDRGYDRIFIDGCNLSKRVRDAFINICLENKIFWVLLLVGKRTKVDAQQYCSFNTRGCTLEHYRQQLIHWGTYYDKQLKALEELKTYSYVIKGRLMKDTQNILLTKESTGYAVHLGFLKSAVSIKTFFFSDLEKAELNYSKAISMEHRKV